MWKLKNQIVENINLSFSLRAHVTNLARLRVVMHIDIDIYKTKWPGRIGAYTRLVKYNSRGGSIAERVEQKKGRRPQNLSGIIYASIDAELNKGGVKVAFISSMYAI